MRDKTKQAEYNKAYREANRERAATYRKEYYAAHREEAVARAKVRNADPNVRARNKAYREANKDLVKARRRARHLTHREVQIARVRQQRTGFTPQTFAATLTAQEGKCAVCRRAFGPSVRPHADHCHDTKTPRGVLCPQCNMAEGAVKKSGISPSEWGARLEAYLENPPVKQVTDLL